MRTYYEVGNACGHQHRTLSGATRCAAAWINQERVDLTQEAAEHGMTLRDYRAMLLTLEHQGGGIIHEIHEV